MQCRESISLPLPSTTSKKQIQFTQDRIALMQPANMRRTHLKTVEIGPLRAHLIRTRAVRGVDSHTQTNTQTKLTTPHRLVAVDNQYKQCTIPELQHTGTGSPTYSIALLRGITSDQLASYASPASAMCRKTLTTDHMGLCTKVSGWGGPTSIPSRAPTNTTRQLNFSTGAGNHDWIPMRPIPSHKQSLRPRCCTGPTACGLFMAWPGQCMQAYGSAPSSRGFYCQPP
jgi:hypothetical protein